MILKELFKQSAEGFENYRATFTRIDAIYPINGADRLVRAVVCGRDIVISKDLPKDDLYIYVPVETSLSHKYLGKNNLYRIASDSYQLNSNFEEVSRMLQNGKSFEDLSMMGGFFEKNGRVKQIKIRGTYSQGYLMNIDSLINTYDCLKDFNVQDFNELEGVSFDIIGDEIFCQKYLVGGKRYVAPMGDGQKHFNKRQRNLNHAKSTLVPGQFAYHYDTRQFGDHYKEFSPTDRVSISVKVHGSSGIFANVKCYKRKEDCNNLQKMFYWIYRPQEYRLLYASRTRIRNEKVYDTDRPSNNFYGSDIWGPVRDLLEPYIDRDMIVYGEICGYVEGTTKMIQKGHDYGCRPGEWKFMPYRIVTIEKGNRFEWDLWQVEQWTLNVKCDMEHRGEIEKSMKIMPVKILFNGRFKDLYKDLTVDDSWNINLLERMKNDRDVLGMEMQEPLCKMKAPREGVVIRKNGDDTPRAWKLKSAAHYDLERKAHDSGEKDMEEEN